MHSKVKDGECVLAWLIMHAKYSLMSQMPIIQHSRTTRSGHAFSIWREGSIVWKKSIDCVKIGSGISVILIDRHCSVEMVFQLIIKWF